MPTLRFDGYVQITMPYKITFYQSQLTDGERVRVLKPKFLTIGEAIHYGRTVAARYNKIYGPTH